jgi:hypothetical protein
MRPPRSLRTRATEIASLLVLGTGLTTLFLGVDWFWVVFAVGFAVFVPIVSLLADDDDVLEETDAMLDGLGPSPNPSPADTGAEDALTTLRARYARGELTDAQFERKLAALLETETFEDVEDRTRRRQRESADPTDNGPSPYTPDVDPETA